MRDLLLIAAIVAVVFAKKAQAAHLPSAVNAGGPATNAPGSSSSPTSSSGLLPGTPKPPTTVVLRPAGPSPSPQVSLLNYASIVTGLPRVAQFGDPWDRTAEGTAVQRALMGVYGSAFTGEGQERRTDILYRRLARGAASGSRIISGGGRG